MKQWFSEEEEKEANQNHTWGTFQIISTPGDSDKLPNPREESPSSVPLLLLYLYAVLGREKSRAIATERNILISSVIEVTVTYASSVW